MAEYLTFNDILAIVKSATRTTRGSSKDTLIGYLINQVYLEEIMSIFPTLRPPYWLLRLSESNMSIAPETVTGITQANPAVVTVSSNTSFAAGSIIELSSVAGMTEINGITGVVASVSGAEITTDIDASGFSAWTSGGLVAHRGIDVSSDIGSILSAGWNGYTPPMEPLSHSQVENGAAFHNEGNTSRPEHYLYIKNFNSAGSQTDRLVWYPGADAAYRLRYWYVEQATRLATTAVPLLPFKHHEMIAAGVLARLIEGGSESKIKIENQSMWPMLYQNHLAAIRKENDDYWDSVIHGKIKVPYLL